MLALLSGLWFFNYYKKDKDKRKLMFSIAFFVSTFSFIYKLILSMGYYTTESNLFLENVFYWSSIPLMVAVLIASTEGFFSIKQFALLFKIFLVATVTCFIMFVMPISVIYIIILTYQIIAVVTITSLSYYYVRKREFSALLFLLALFSFTIAGYSMPMDIPFLSVFSFSMGFAFIGLVFVVSPKIDISYKKGIGTYFSLQKKLESVKAELRESEEKLHSLLEYTQNIIMTVDRNGIILFINRAILGFIPEKVTGMSIYDLLKKNITA